VRLPGPVAERLATGPFLELCRQHGVPAKFCMKKLLGTI
jgi:hypothetical protein